MAVDFSSSDEHVMLVDMLRRFMVDENNFEVRAHRLLSSPPDRIALWRPLAELGALGALFPDEYGGFGGSPHDMAVVVDALAPSLPVEPLIVGTVICGRLLMAVDGTRGRKLIDELIAGEFVPVLAHAEGFDPFAEARMTADQVGEGFVLTGVKPVVRHADVASHFLVTAAVEGAQTLFVVDAKSPGLHLENSRLIDGAGAANLRFDRVLVAPDGQLQLPGLSSALSDALEWGLAGLAVETASLVSATNSATYEYLGVREQFGTRLATFQAIQHKAADMAIAGEEAAAMAHAALHQLALPAGPERSASILRSSLACDMAGRAIAHQAIQLFGGMGVSDELIVSHIARRLTAIRSQIGTIDTRAARLTVLEGNG